jgi:hypothetical protein
MPQKPISLAGSGADVVGRRVKQYLRCCQVGTIFVLELMPCREDEYDESIVDHVEERLSKNARMTVTTMERHSAALENVPHTSMSIMVRAAHSCPAFLIQWPPCRWCFSGSGRILGVTMWPVSRHQLFSQRFPWIAATIHIHSARRRPEFRTAGRSRAITRLRPLVPAIDLLPIKQGSVDEDNW